MSAEVLVWIISNGYEKKNDNDMQQIDEQAARKKYCMPEYLWLS
jgi:hypothetical protein